MQSLAPRIRHILFGSFVSVACFTLFFSGCGAKNRPETATISGKVESQGKPITNGRVVFSSSDLGVNQSANLTANGTFQSSAPLQPGNYRVYLLPPDQGDVPPGLANEQPSSKLENVPVKYQSERTSDLNVTLNKGENNVTLDLKP